MNPVSRWFCESHKINFVWAVLPLATVSTVLTAAVHSARADQIRVCERYGVVRGLSDHEVPLLPRRSIASCARSYQTLYQTYRVLSASPGSQVSDANTDNHAIHSQIEISTPAPPISSAADEFTTDAVDSSHHPE